MGAMITIREMKELVSWLLKKDAFRDKKYRLYFWELDNENEPFIYLGMIKDIMIQRKIAYNTVKLLKIKTKNFELETSHRCMPGDIYLPGLILIPEKDRVLFD